MGASVVKEESTSDSSTSMELDRSHLMAEPKHKQDKQAVRENLQSFRQVAHLSARSALAKHSLRQLRNATIAKGVLLFAAVIATISFLIEPLWGHQLHVWKCAGCALAAILSALEFSRSWSQLYRPISQKLPPAQPDEGAARKTLPQLPTSNVTMLDFAEETSPDLKDTVTETSSVTNS
jgi:hypothetical protein